MSTSRALHLLAVIGLGIALAGCGAPTSAPKAAKPPSQHKKTSAPPAPAPSTGGTTSSGTGSGASDSGSTASGSGATLTYTIAPPGQTSGGAMAMLSLANLPQGWSLQTLEAWSSAGEMSSETPSQAMTSTFGQPQGGFSMGSDGQIISYFFANPPGKWAKTTCHFTFVFSTPSGSQSISSSSFTFPQE